MPLTPVKCPCCGADIELDDGPESDLCPNCGVSIIFRAARAFYMLEETPAKIRRGIETKDPAYFHEALDIDPDNQTARKQLALLQYTGLIDKTHAEEWLITRFIKNSIYYRPILWTTYFSRSFFGNQWKLLSQNSLIQKIKDEGLTLDMFFDFEHFKELLLEDQQEIIEIASGEWFFFIHDNERRSGHHDIRELPNVYDTCQAILLLGSAMQEAGLWTGESVELFGFYAKLLHDQIQKGYEGLQGPHVYLAEEMLKFHEKSCKEEIEND